MNIIGGLSRERPILLVADQPWDSTGGGAVILKSLLGNSIGNGIIWVSLHHSERDLEAGHYGLKNSKDDPADEILALAESTRAAAIWFVLHGRTTLVAPRVARRTSLPIHATVHDDPAFATAIRSRRQFLWTPCFAGALKSVLRAAKSVDVVCDAMAKRYAEKYGVKCEVLHRGLTEPVVPSLSYSVSVSGLTLGILGNVYSYRQLPILAKALEASAGELGVRGRILICGQGFGARLERDFAGRIDVEAVGHLEEAEAIGRLRQCMALYLNYPFGRINKVLRETSFPTKLSTYIYAARPILIHAPPGTSVEHLPGGRHYATAWTTMDASDGAKHLAEIARRPETETSYHAEGEAVRHRYYDAREHRRTLERIIGNLLGQNSVPRE